jgi:hypothetical protein
LKILRAVHDEPPMSGVHRYRENMEEMTLIIVGVISLLKKNDAALKKTLYSPMFTM